MTFNQFTQKFTRRQLAPVMPPQYPYIGQRVLVGKSAEFRGVTCNLDKSNGRVLVYWYDSTAEQFKLDWFVAGYVFAAVLS